MEAFTLASVFLFMKPLIFLAFFTVLIGSVHARIGETPQQCVMRYGEPIKGQVGDEIMAFQKAGFYLMVEFFAGKCESISYRKVDPGPLDEGADITAVEFETLRESNGNGAAWSQTNEGGAGKNVWRTERRLHAI